MNRTYALVWNPSLATWNVTDERARRRGKGAGAVLAAALLMPAAAIAADLPTGGNVVAGSGQINTPSANQMVINQASNKLAIDWQSFDIAAGHKVTFNQPSSDSIALNRVLGADGSKIMGQLDANGRVFLINPNGVLFGAGAQVNVGGLVASTLNISDSDFAAGNYRFKGDGSNASVINKGKITVADGGSVALLGGTVSNNGVIVANQGTVALAAGNAVTLDFAGDGLLKVQVDEAVVDALVENHQLIKADGGQVLLTANAGDALLKTVVNNTGVIEAQTLGEKNGKIVLEAGATDTVTNSGMLNASGVSSSETGGTVKVLGGAVKLLATSAIDVSGDAGGGTALIGGNFLGTGPEQNAKTTTVEAGASIKADAITAGKGGSVAVWSDGATQFNGSITARGGSTTGNGGKVETSGKSLNINASASVNTAATHGTAGDWLLDPDDITIGDRNIWDNSYGINVDTTVLTTALNNGNVTIKTTGSSASCTGTTCNGTPGNGDIIVLDTIGATIGGTNWTSNSALTLSAYRNIHFKYVSDNNNGTGGSILSNYGGAGNVVLRADNSATGTGTVTFDDSNYNFVYLADSASNTSIYYNPIRYNSPTIYGNYVFSTYNAYMAINVTGSAASKVYDGLITTSIAGLTSQLTMPGGLTLDTSSAVGTFADKNVGTNKTVTITGIKATGSGATTSTNSDGATVVSYGSNNYYINGLDNKTAAIAAKTISATDVTASDKTYDGTTTATLSGSGSIASSIVNGDSVSLSGGTGTFADANAGVGKAVTVTGFNLSGTDAGNYILTLPTGLTATINKANLTLSGTKVYDGTTSVAGSTLTATGVAGQTFTITGSGDATNLASKNVQTGSTLSSAAGLSLGTSSNGGLNSNYNVLGTSGSSYAVTAKGITLAGITASDKTYDATTSAALNTTNVGYSGIVNGDDVSLGGSGTGSFATKGVGINKSVTVSGYSLSGADAGNYVVTQPTGLTASISKADLVVSGVSGVNKTYDATNTATLSGSASVSALQSDVVSVVGTGSGSFADANAGIGKNITVTGYTLSGTDANNYNVVQPTNVTATINKANVTLSGSKVYDGSTTVAGSTLTASGVAGQSFTVMGSGDASNLASKNVQTGTTLGSATGLSLGTSSNGGLSSNYNVLGTSGSSYNVTAKGITLTGITASDKTYDATTTANLNTNNVSYSGIVNGDSVSLGGSGTGSFATKDVGINKTVTVSGYGLSGADAGNYLVTQPTGLTASITKADLSLTGLSTTNKVYDATTTATLSGIAGLAATLGSDVVSLSGTGAGNFADKNVGANKAVIVSGYTLSGIDANNYRIAQPVGLTADISKAALTLTANDVSKVAGQSIALSGFTSSGLLGADSISTVSLSSLGQPTTATAGSYAIVASNAVGAALSNYNVNYQDGTLLVSPAATTPATPITASSQPYISVLASNGQSVLTPAKQQDNEPKALNQNMLVTNPLNVGLNLQVISDGIRLPEGI